MLDWLMTNLDLNYTWFLIVGALFTGYAILDGFDLGVGILHLLTKTETHRRLSINAIGPVWDGNEVWLVTGGGALFAAFPEVYASVFSGFYIAFMLLLVMLIFRAVAIEFRSKHPSPIWRQFWDISFSVSSLGGALLMGVALGNIAQGIPLTENHIYFGGLLGLLNPYAILVGLTTVALFTMHANIYLSMKTEGDLQKQVRGWVIYTIPTLVILYFITTMATLLYLPQMTDGFRSHPEIFVVALLNILTLAAIPREIYYGRDGRAFLFSCLNIALLMVIFGIGIQPYMVYAINDPSHSLTIYNGASSQRGLAIMLIIAVMAIPSVATYTFFINWVFKGKVKLESTSY